MITASALQLHPDSMVVVDEEAAGELKMYDYYKWIQDNKPGAPKPQQ
jgi:glucosamine-6-phosphate deaminase